VAAVGIGLRDLMPLDLIHLDAMQLLQVCRQLACDDVLGIFIKHENVGKDLGAAGI
jgi:hypothetical protein